MRIDFFEEFPHNGLEKAGLVDFDSTVYIAAKSFEEFLLLKEKLNKINPNLDVGYWPILEKSYWVSPFSYTYELENLYNDLSKNNRDEQLKVLIDLELPFLNTKLFLRNMSSFSRNKKLIKKIFRNSKNLNLDISTAEYPIYSELTRRIYELLGIHYPIEKFSHKKIIIFYSSMPQVKYFQNRIKNTLQKKAKQWKEKLQIGLGTLAIGIFGNEPILPPENLDKDLNYFNEQGIERVVIFRLGGLNKKYLKIIKKYL